MLLEENQIKTSAEKVKKNGVPNVPMLFFISNGDGTGVSENKWRSFQTSYIEASGSGKYIKLDCGHYVHDVEYKKIAEESKRFINDIVNRK